MAGAGTGQAVFWAWRENKLSSGHQRRRARRRDPGRNQDGGEESGVSLNNQRRANGWVSTLPTRSGGVLSATLFRAKRLSALAPVAWVAGEWAGLKKRLPHSSRWLSRCLGLFFLSFLASLRRRDASASPSSTDFVCPKARKDSVGRAVTDTLPKPDRQKGCQHWHL